MMQNAIVFLIVACAACAVAARYMPNALRHLAWERISTLAHRRGWSSVARHADMKRQSAPGCDSGCKQCDGCGTSVPRATEQPIDLHIRTGKKAAK